MKTFILLCGFVILPVWFVEGQGTILWNESVNGSLSENFEQPTSLGSLQAGTSSVIGVSEFVAPPPFMEYHPNYFTFQVPEGFVIEAINLQIDRPQVWAWIGTTGFSNEIAFHMNPVSGNLLPQWGLVSIPAGAYGMYMANLDEQPSGSVANFRLDFVVVPEPSPLWTVIAGLGWFGFSRWRRVRSGRHRRK